jgi:hypothetical protein
MPSRALAEHFVVRVSAIGDHATRVGLLRTLLPSLSTTQLDEVKQRLAERAGLRDSAAQITLLALAEALVSLQLSPETQRVGRASQQRVAHDADDAHTEDDSGATDEAADADWGTGRPLTLGERKSLARRPDRRLLERALRDPHPDVVAELLHNPRLTEADVARLCASPAARPAVLLRVFAAPRWAVRPRVHRALAANPRTPLEVALALVPMLARAQLRELAADVRLAPTVRARALEVLRRLPPTPAGPPAAQ